MEYQYNSNHLNQIGGRNNTIKKIVIGLAGLMILITLFIVGSNLFKSEPPAYTVTLQNLIKKHQEIIDTHDSYYDELNDNDSRIASLYTYYLVKENIEDLKAEAKKAPSAPADYITDATIGPVLDDATSNGRLDSTFINVMGQLIDSNKESISALSRQGISDELGTVLENALDDLLAAEQIIQ